MVLSVFFCILAVSSLYFLRLHHHLSIISHSIYVTFTLLAFFPIFYLSVHYIVNIFTGDGINDTIIFYLSESGFPWGSISEYFPVIGLAILINLVMLITIYFIAKHFTKKKLINKARTNRLLTLLFFISVVLSVYFNPSSKNIAFHIDFSKALLSKDERLALKNEFLKQLITNPVIRPTTIDINGKPIARKNLIYIYLESFDLAYVENPLFNKINHNITALTQQGLYFNHAYEGINTKGGTVQGIFTSQCGIGLYKDPRYMNNKLFYCMGDVFNELDYDTSYYGGTKSEFGGKDDIFKLHQFKNIYGKEILSKRYPNKIMSPWGFYDEDLFPIWRNELVNRQLNTPFASFMLTLDTHGPVNYSPSCKTYFQEKLPSLAKQENRHETYMGAIACTDYLLNRFINSVKSSKLWDNTYIVLTSDHIPPLNYGIEKIIKNTDERKLYFVILGKDIKPQIVSKPITKLDFAATILDIMGITDKLGLGRSALKTDVIAKNTKDINSLIYKWSVGIEDYIVAGQDNSILEINDNQVIYEKYKHPFPFVYNINSYSEYGKNFIIPRNKNIIIAPDSKAKAFIWGNKCKYMSALGYNSNKPEANCLAVGAFGGDITVGKADKTYYFSENEINKLLIQHRNFKKAEKQIKALELLNYNKNFTTIK